MSFRFRKANCVVLGTFNMYILHPEWLAKHSIIEPGTEVSIETNFERPGFRFRFVPPQGVWTVAPNRIMVETDAADLDCGSKVAKVLRALPETPLVALGSNFHYEASSDELGSLPDAIRDFPRGNGPGGERLSRLAFHYTVEPAAHEIANLYLIIQENQLELACNMHRKLESREKANRKAVESAEQFSQDQAVLEQLAQHYFGVTISHDADSK